MTIIANKASVGDIVVLVEHHSYHTIKMKRHTYDSYIIAKVAKVSRKGQVLAAAHAGDADFIRPIGEDTKVFVLTDSARQKAAQDIFNATIEPHTYRTIDEVRFAIKNMEEANAAHTL